MMRIKILIILTCFFFILSCNEKIENPNAPTELTNDTDSAKLEFMEDPYLHCPNYDPILEYQKARLSYYIINNGTAPTISFIYVVVEICDITTDKMIFRYQGLVRQTELPVGWSFNGTLIFDMETEIWDKYVSGEAYKEVKIIGGNTN